MDLVKRYKMPEENTEPPKLFIQATANVVASGPMDQHGAGQHGAVQHGAAVMGQRRAEVMAQ